MAVGKSASKGVREALDSGLRPAVVFFAKEPHVSLRRLSILGFCTAALAGCGGNTVPPSGNPDMAVQIPDGGDMATSANNCSSDKACSAPTPYCDPKTSKCVGCAGDQQCGDGKVCSAGQCVPGCSQMHGCGDAGQCEADGGQCHSCASDKDCAGPDSPRCELATGRCVACQPTNDNCLVGKYCTQTNGTWACAQGCAKDEDCKANAPDGGAGTAACCNHVCADTSQDGANCGACGKSCNGMSCCGSACTDPNADVKNCGGCGAVCQTANAAAACMAGKCAVGKCSDGYADCDKDPSNGCEVNTNTDPMNCLGCGNVCAAAHAKAGCNMACTVVGCDDGYADCNKKFNDGCEVTLASDVNNCGACGMACAAVSNGTPACTAGKCLIGSCNGSFVDCDGQYGNGCEVDSASDVKNCGSCGKSCAPVANGTPGCAMGQCGIGSCSKSYKDCNMNANDGCEVNSSGDLNNCGACGKVCAGIANGAPGCANGACGVGACSAPFRDCNNNANDGCETNTGNDVKNCGACGMVCPNVPNGAPACTDGTCGVTACKAPFQDCDHNPQNGCESDTSKDVANCSACGMVCPMVANGQAGCANSVCGIAVCNQFYKDCDNKAVDGCEVNTSTDPMNCGACGAVCGNVANGSPGCANGICGIGACTAPFQDCNKNPFDGCEINLTTDVNNCGGCGKVCPAVAHGTASCANSACGVGTCHAGYKDCNNNPVDGCEVNILTDVNNCGACAAKCAGMCQNGTCVSNLYAPSGIQTNVPVASLTGWTLCYQDTYASTGTAVSSILNQCSRAKLLVACRQTGSNTISLLAWAGRSDVTFQVPGGSCVVDAANQTHVANGVAWYFNSSWSWGFAPPNEMIYRCSCDYNSTPNGELPDPQLRMCWHTSNGNIGSGYRCGSNDLNNNANYERLIYQAD